MIRVRFGVPFEVTSLKGAVDLLVEIARSGKAVPVRLVNAYSVVSAHEDENYLAVMAGGGINFPDGKPIVWALNAPWRRNDRAGRVRGPSLFAGVLDVGRKHELKHFFVGTTDATLTKLVDSLSDLYPGVAVAGTFAPPFKNDTRELLDIVAEELRGVDADLVWIALGTPKQDIVGVGLASVLGLPTVGVGAAFDFMAGSVSEAPRVVQDSGFEWVYRLAQDPRRLWRRYTIGNLQFGWLVVRDFFLTKRRW